MKRSHKASRSAVDGQKARHPKSPASQVPIGPPWLGAHLSVADGYHRAVEEAARLGMNTLQIFTGSPQTWPVGLSDTGRASSHDLGTEADRWLGKPLEEKVVRQFREHVQRFSLHRPIAHSCYLVNLGAHDKLLWSRSIAALTLELRRAGQLGLSHVVVHPGAFTESDEASGIRRVASALDEVLRRRSPQDARILLENTAGQGTSLGWRFEQLAQILEQLRQPELVDVCLDTCHAFAAGYEWSTRQGFYRTKQAIAATVGLAKLQAIHVNDSKRERGSRVDRHEHIGYGQIGVDGFRRLLHDSDFRLVPMYLETPKGKKGKRSWDEINLQTLRQCAE